MQMVAAVIVFGVVIVWAGVLLLRVAYPDDPAKGIRPRNAEPENLAVRFVTYAVRRRPKRMKAGE